MDKKKSQKERFEETAKEIGCDEDEANFDRILEVVAKAPKPSKKAAKK